MNGSVPGQMSDLSRLQVVWRGVDTRNGIKTNGHVFFEKRGIYVVNLGCKPHVHQPVLVNLSQMSFVKPTKWVQATARKSHVGSFEVNSFECAGAFAPRID